MTSNAPIIIPLRKEQEVREMVELILEPGIKSAEAKAFCELIMSIAVEENEEEYNVALTAAHHAFSMTDEFHKAFERFVGYPMLETPGGEEKIAEPEQNAWKNFMH